MDAEKNYGNNIEQQKRMMIQKRRKKRAKRRLTVLLFLLICAGIIVTAFKAPFFNISKVICEGHKQFTEQQIREIARVEEGKNIFSTSIQTIADNLLANPEIASVEVKRVFPNKVKIVVAEAAPVAYVAYGKEILLIDKKGKIIKNVENNEKEKPKNIPQVAGVEVASSEPGKNISKDEDSRAEKLYNCLDMLDAEEMTAHVNFVDFSDLSDIKIDYENRIFMLLGAYDELDYKLKFVKKVIKENITEHEKAQFDYRGDKLYVGARGDDEKEKADKDKTAKTEENKDVKNEDVKKTDNEQSDEKTEQEE